MRKIYILLAIIILSFTAYSQNNDRLKLQTEISKKNADTKLVVSEEKSEANLTYIQLNNLGVKKVINESDQRGALKYFKKALKLNPKCFDCKYNFGRAHLQLGKYDFAAEAFRELIKIKPDFADGHSSLGETLANQRLFRESIVHFQKALEINPNDAFTLTNYAISLQNLGQYEKALDNFDKSLKINPKLSATHNNKGFTLFKMGKFKSAIKSLKKAYALDPNNPEINNNLGVALDRVRKRKQARKHYLEALRAKPDFAMAQYNLASNYLESGDRDEAYRRLKLLEKTNYALAKDLRKYIWGKYVIDAKEKGKNKRDK